MYAIVATYIYMYAVIKFMSKLTQFTLGAVSTLLSASNALGATGSSSTFNIGQMYGKLVSGVDSEFQAPLQWVYNNLSHLFLAVPMIVVMIIVITKSGIFGGHGRDASTVVQGEQQISHVLKLVITGAVVCGLIYVVGTQFIL
jgi:hypothetical protein